MFAETLSNYHKSQGQPIFAANTILNRCPEEWAADLGIRACEKVREFVKGGRSKSDLLTWETRVTELGRGMLKDRISAMISTEKITGNGN